ncbi:MAG: hypothetical protein WBW27_25940, partial [Pseudolabrys sp.]
TTQHLLSKRMAFGIIPAQRRVFWNNSSPNSLSRRSVIVYLGSVNHPRRGGHVQARSAAAAMRERPPGVEIDGARRAFQFF